MPQLQISAVLPYYLRLEEGDYQTVQLYLLVQRSLFREPGDFWQRLMVSYQKRNDIIHRGQNANENEARQGIDVARRVVEFMNAIPVPGAGAEDAAAGQEG